MRDKYSSFSLLEVILPLVPVLAGTLAGWLLTSKLAGSVAAQSFLYISIAVVPALITAAIISYTFSKNSVRYQMYYAAAISAGFAWLMLSLLLPLFWVTTIHIYVKISLIFLILFLCIFNVYRAYRNFDLKWRATGAGLFARFFDSKDGFINWQKVNRPLNLYTTLYIPGIPERFYPIIAALCIVSMLLGLNLRTPYPIFSIFAWGIPSGLIVSGLFEMIGLCFAQASKISELEREFDMRIRPKN